MKAIHADAQVGRLLVSFVNSTLSLPMVKGGDLLVELLRQDVDADRIALDVRPERDLRERLLRERGAHHERWVAVGAPEVYEAPAR